MIAATVLWLSVWAKPWYFKSYFNIALHFSGWSNKREDAKRFGSSIWLSDSCDSYYLTCSIKTTEVVYDFRDFVCSLFPKAILFDFYISQHLEILTRSLQSQWKVNDSQKVDKFTYLGSTLSRVVHIDKEVNARIAKARAAFGRLRGIKVESDLTQSW